MNMQYFSTFELRALRFQCMHELENKVDSPVPRALETTIFFSLSYALPRFTLPDRSFGNGTNSLRYSYFIVEYSI